MRSRTINDTLSKIWPSGGGRHGLMVMALDCGTGGREFKPAQGNPNKREGHGTICAVV